MNADQMTHLFASSKPLVERWCLSALAVITLHAIVVSGSPQSVSQPGDAPSRFEVASIRENTAGRSASIRYPAGGTFVATAVTLVDMIGYAYAMQDYQIIGGPDWIRSTRFDIQAKASPATPQDAARGMVKALLADRFRLAVTRESRQLPVYALIPARSDKRLGPQLKVSQTEGAPSKPAVKAPAPETAFANLFAACLTTLSTSDGFRLVTGTSATMAELAKKLTEISGLRRLVVDRTEMPGRFELRLSWQPEPLDAVRSTGSSQPTVTGRGLPAERVSLFTALQDQLGLKLESDRADVDVIIIDRVEQPTPN